MCPPSSKPLCAVCWLLCGYSRLRVQEGSALLARARGPAERAEDRGATDEEQSSDFSEVYSSPSPCLTASTQNTPALEAACLAAEPKPPGPAPAGHGCTGQAPARTRHTQRAAGGCWAAPFLGHFGARAAPCAWHQ